MEVKSHILKLKPKPKEKLLPSLKHVHPLPISLLPDRETTEVEKIEGLFTGFSVDVYNADSMQKLCLQGSFGQGSLSRSFPRNVREHGSPEKAEIITQRQYERRKEWSGEFEASDGKQVYVVNENHEARLAEKGDRFTMKHVREMRLTTTGNPYDLRESLTLFLEEAFYLMHQLKVLQIRDLGTRSVLSETQALISFSGVQENFVARYCAYVYLRTKNWVVKSGIKFGGDFVIYVKGPQFYHASYIVLLQGYRDNQPLEDNMDEYDFQRLNRIAETTAKDLLLLEIHYPKHIDIADSEECLRTLNEFRVGEKFPRHQNYITGRS